MAIPETSQQGISPLSFQKDRAGQTNPQYWLSTLCRGLTQCWGRSKEAQVWLAPGADSLILGSHPVSPPLVSFCVFILANSRGA